MDLIERYLQAVRHWLPTTKRHDIIAELSEDIHSQIDEREASLGRPLTETEVEAMLLERGRPMLVASRYLPQEYLIGPELFPIYRFVLKIVLLCSGAPTVLALVSLIVFGSRAARRGAASLARQHRSAVGIVRLRGADGRDYRHHRLRRARPRQRPRVVSRQLAAQQAAARPHFACRHVIRDRGQRDLPRLVVRAI